MELQFQHHQVPAAKTSKVKSRTKTPHSSRFVGVRQRPSGRWVAEIKDTTQKIRMWLGTFETAEEAARAYDEAACLLRGTNTRTNFNTHPSADSPMASRIRNLLHHKKLKKNEAHPRPTSCSPSSSNNSSLSTAETSSVSHDTKLESQKAEEVYRPCFGIEAEEPNSSWVFESGFDRIPLLDGFEFNKHAFHLESAAPEVSEFERMQVERQISASLYAMNGVQEYLETVNDLSDPLWDLPPLYQMCRTW